jgi:signal transduction histidine kinase
METAPPDRLAAEILDLLALGSGPELDRVLDRVLGTARRAVDARYAALGIPDGRGGFARFRTLGISERRAAEIGELPRTHGVLGALLEEGPILLDDIRRHPRFSWFPARHPVMTDFVGVPVRHRGAVLGNLFLSGRRHGRFSAADRRVLETIAGYAGVAIANAQLYERAQALAVVEERTRVARELHDAATQRLFSLVYEAHAAGLRVADADGEMAAVFGRLEGQAAEALRELRGLVHALRPKSLERDGLVAALGAHLDGLSRSHGVEVVLEAADPELGLTLEQEHGLLRIAQEAVHNAVRHGGGAAVRVRVRVDGGVVELAVRDEGPGFDADALPRTVRTLGMSTMRERAAALGAGLDVASAPGRGCVVTARVPVRRRGRG